MSHGEPSAEEVGRILNSAYRKVDTWKEHAKLYRIVALDLCGGDKEKLKAELDKAVDKL